ncbi:MAG TPA: hypothetical protein PKD45_03250 [Flavobacteriales bacterium]|nr:hypothetical protein [Flavobacteriales bacterium]
MKSHFLPIIAVLLMASCATTKETTVKTMEIYGPGVLQNPVIADLDVREQKVQGTATGRKSVANTVKKLALANALETSHADVLVAPVYELVTKGGRTTATVTGYPATYSNFRHATPADSSLVTAGYMQHANTAIADDAPVKRKGIGAIVGGLLAVGTTLLILLL